MILLNRRTDNVKHGDALLQLGGLFVRSFSPISLYILYRFRRPLKQDDLVFMAALNTLFIFVVLFLFIAVLSGSYGDMFRWGILGIIACVFAYIGRVFLPVDCDEEELLPLLYAENLFLMKGEEDSEVEADGMIKEVVSQLEGANEVEKQVKERELVRVVGESLHGYAVQGEQRLYTIAPQGTSVSKEELYWLEEKGLKQLQETPILIYKWLKERVRTQVERFTIYEIVLAKGEQSQWYEGRMMLEKKRWDQSEFAHLLAHPSSIKVIVLPHKEHWSMPKAVGTLYRSL